MVKYSTVAFVMLLSLSNCLADTFVNIQTGESFNGYILGRKKVEKTQVRVENKSQQYIDLGQYKITRNYLGRKNKVFIFSINQSPNLIVEAEAFEKGLDLASKQGVMLILIEIDSPGIRLDLAERISKAIIDTEYCTTVAFVGGGGKKFGGAFSTTAIIAAACDKVYMRDGASLGGEPPFFAQEDDSVPIEMIYGEQTADRLYSSWPAYAAAIAERNKRNSLLIKAMADESIEIIEVDQQGKTSLIEERDKKRDEKTVQKLSQKGVLLSLKADAAQRFGIADGAVSSREQLLSQLEASQATNVNDRKVRTARLGFERTKRRFDRILRTISSREEQAQLVIEDIAAIEKELDRTNRGLNSSGYMIVGGEVDIWAYADADVFDLGDLLRDSDELFNELETTSIRLIKEYNNAITIASKYPDLRHYLEKLEESMEIVGGRLKRLPSRSRRDYGR